ARHGRLLRRDVRASDRPCARGGRPRQRDGRARRVQDPAGGEAGLTPFLSVSSLRLSPLPLRAVDLPSSPAIAFRAKTGGQAMPDDPKDPDMISGGSSQLQGGDDDMISGGSSQLGDDTGDQSYTVVKGDTLSAIAKKFYGK